MSNEFQIKTISAKEAFDQDNDNTVFLDVRPNEVYRSSHFDRFINACVYEVTFFENISHLVKDKETKIITYNHKEDSMEGVTALKKLTSFGYENIYIIDGCHKDLINCGFEHIGDRSYLEESFELTDGEYSYVDGSVIWIGRNATGKHLGDVKIKESSLQIRDNKIYGETLIDMEKITNEDIHDSSLNSMLIEHLKSDDFFSVFQYKEAKFKIVEGSINSDASFSNKNITLKGELTLLDQTHPITILGTIVQLKEKIILQSHFDFDRTLWNIVYGSSKFFPFLGIHLIFDPVSIEVRIEFQKK